MVFHRHWRAGVTPGSQVLKIIRQHIYAFIKARKTEDWTPVVGSWNGDGITKIGVFRPGTGFYLDMNNNGQYDGPSTDKFLPWGLQFGDKPITGRW